MNTPVAGASENSSGLPDDAGGWLLPAARAAIAAHLGEPVETPETPAWARRPAACFVTLTTGGSGHPVLRGCIGTLAAWRPLAEDVCASAVAAATHDPRFPAVTSAELAGLRVEVSVLSASAPIRFTSQHQLVSRLRPGIDGLILEWDGYRGTFLPQVWDQIPDPTEFLTRLKQKAGLAPSWWSRDATVRRYTVTAWQEEP
ncbi:MAG: AmmeMemoRadiSam system protein A [Acidipropionibacterium jensenii]|nr:AmmeMemoRadiSam system protein A [Acidipropionibacterium jensenii]